MDEITNEFWKEYGQMGYFDRRKALHPFLAQINDAEGDERKLTVLQGLIEDLFVALRK